MKKLFFALFCLTFPICLFAQKDYVFCIATKNQKDTSWQKNNEGWVLIRKLSQTLWNYFEPGSEWKPAAGMEKYAD